MSKIRTLGGTILMVALLPSAPSLWAQGASAVSAVQPMRALDRDDRAFIDDAARSGMAEVQLGRMAQERAANAQVKAFAEHMVADHGKANGELQQLAAAKGVPLPAQPGTPGKTQAAGLHTLKGADFDLAYMKDMVDDHKKAVATFEKASRSARDPDVKAFAAQKLPTLQSHLQQAQTTYDALRRGTAASR